MFDYELKSFYNALVARKLRGTPTYSEVSREARSMLATQVDALMGLR
jgi:hypothetical protein